MHHYHITVPIRTLANQLGVTVHSSAIDRCLRLIEHNVEKYFHFRNATAIVRLTGGIDRIDAILIDNWGENPNQRRCCVFEMAVLDAIKEVKNNIM